MNAERILRRIRQHPALWGEMGDGKEAQAARILRKCKQRLAPQWRAHREAIKHARGQRILQMYA
jgi:hypothetical protein